ncbi:class I SAM-dependent methyltransferase [Marmoricola sp. URHB0036]|uniref:class I SAM-dependent methyltransferase n=1 Tax=Marmoricola sp. URHB0036 TaxID=1298863 RepID=UPI000401E33C|nr:class I SAM-dependent methyltransferase [Marmoricola sp. URHB0036]
MNDIALAYDAAADAWSTGSARVYDALASAIADRAPDVTGHRVLDIGAGTGVLGLHLLRRRAAHVVAVDLAGQMLRKAGSGVSPVIGDATALPFADGAFDLAATAFCFSHLDRPEQAVREARRVAAGLLSGSFAGDSDHPAKAVVDEVVRRYGFDTPGWYTTMKGGHPMDDPERLAGLARTAGFGTVEVDLRQVDTGIAGNDLAAWRLGMAHYAPFLATLDARSLDALRRDVESAVDGLPPLTMSVLVLTAS